MKSRGHPNLAFKGRTWDADSGRSQDVLMTSPRGPSDYSNLDVPTYLGCPSSDHIRLVKCIEKHFNSQVELRIFSSWFYLIIVARRKGLPNCEHDPSNQ